MKKQPRTRSYRRSELGIGQAAKPVEKALNRLTKGTNERGKGVSGNQDNPLDKPFTAFKLYETCGYIFD